MPDSQPERSKVKKTPLQRIKTICKTSFYASLAAAGLYIAELNNGFIEQSIGNKLVAAEANAVAHHKNTTTFTLSNMQFPTLESKLAELSETKRQPQKKYDLIVKDKQGNLLAEQINLEKYVTLDEVSPEMCWAMVAAEDMRFYQHHGIDHGSTLSAVYHNVQQKGERVRGASTISIQLADQWLADKADWKETKKQEWSYALFLEQRLSKDKILELYLNTVNFGYSRRDKQEIKGVHAAAKYYFNKKPSALSLTESAVLAAMVNLPTTYGTKMYNDVVYSKKTKEDSANFARMLQRTTYVLNKMARLADVYPQTGISKPALLSSMKDINYVKIPFHENGRYAILPEAYEYVDALLDRAVPAIAEHASNGANMGEVNISATIDLSLQQRVRGILLKHRDLLRSKLEKYKSFKHPELVSGAAVVIDLASNDVLALVGGDGIVQGDFLNRATLQYLNPGSSVKPFVLAAALDQGYTLETAFADVQKTYAIPYGSKVKKYTPKNYHGFSGKLVSLHEGLVESKNSIFIALVDDIFNNYGEDVLLHSLQNFGFSLSEVYLSSAIGSFPASLLDIAGAYAVLAEDCTKVSYVAGDVADNNMRFFSAVKTQTSLYEPKPEVQQRACLPDTFTAIDSTLLDVVAGNVAGHPYVKKYQAMYPARGKTGTALNNIVYVAYQPDLGKLVAVAFASDDPEKTGKLPHSIIAAAYAAPAALDVMQYFAEQRQKK